MLSILREKKISFLIESKKYRIVVILKNVKKTFRKIVAPVYWFQTCNKMSGQTFPQNERQFAKLFLKIHKM